MSSYLSDTPTFEWILQIPEELRQPRQFIRYDTVPTLYMAEPVARYVELGELYSDFLRSLLEGNLFLVTAYADDTNRRNLLAWVQWLHNNVPSVCYKSKEKVEAWIADRREAAEAFDTIKP